MAALSPELVHDVLLRLPVKSLLRFRGLSKSSRAEIESADFVKNHLKRTVQSNARQKLIIINHVRTGGQICFADFDDDGLQHSFPLNSPFRSYRHRRFTFMWQMNQAALRGYYANGALYGENRVPSKRKFVGFDLTNEVFFDLPKLPDFGPETVCYHFLMVLGGNIYTQTMHAATPGKLEFYLLVSDKGGEVASENWRKEFEVEGEEIIIRDAIRPLPLACSKGGDSIPLKVISGNLFWYDLEKKTRRKVEIAENSQPWSSLYHVCWESLVSLGNDRELDGAADEESDDHI